MDVSADLEIGLHHLEKNSYVVELRFSLSNDLAIPVPVRGVATFDFERLLSASPDPLAYGNLLGQSLFADTQVLQRYHECRQEAETSSVPLHLRLFIWPGTPKLHDLYWEMLCDPESGGLLVTDQKVLFSRFLSSPDRRRLRLSRRGNLKVLIAIANPTMAENEFSFEGGSPAAINEQDERDRALDALVGLDVVALPPGRVTLEHLVEELSNGYDIVYLVAHGGFSNEEPVILLEDETGAARPANGGTLITRIHELQKRPLLMVLASCQSAEMGKSTDQGALAALGPKLAEAGVPAVLGMQGNVTMSTIASFMPIFFRELKDHGQIDLAVAVARGAVREHEDFWMPALFSRLQGGRIWYTPDFVLDSDEGFTGWDSVLENIDYGTCTPILGSGMLEELIGPTWALAQSWAEQYGYPLSPDDRDDLPQVAQYLAVSSRQQIKPRRELINHLRIELLNRFGRYLPEDTNNENAEQVVAAAGRYLRSAAANKPLAARSVEPHAVLASLPFKVFLTTNPDTMLFDALREAGKIPTLKICRWNDDPRWPRDIWQVDPNYVPDEKHPLVYHLFGHIKMISSLVIKEDDYFDYLVGVTSNRELIPDVVWEALSQSALLFLGFRLEDWDFRALFRSLVAGQRGGLLDEYHHVAAQIHPEESAYVNPQGARRYLESYFRDEKISIYWGRVDDFTSELLRRWEAKQAAQVRAIDG